MMALMRLCEIGPAAITNVPFSCPLPQFDFLPYAGITRLKTESEKAKKRVRNEVFQIFHLRNGHITGLKSFSTSPPKTVLCTFWQGEGMGTKGKSHPGGPSAVN